jgi:hypothetical protein
MGAKSKENVDKKELNKETPPQFNDVISFNNEPDKNVMDSWNQITLSLASNGGYTITKGNKFILYVYLKQNIDGKSVLCVKPFLVTRDELCRLQRESAEFRDEVDTMIAAKDKEETKIIIPESKNPLTLIKKKEDKKKDVKALTDILKSGLEVLKNKEVIRIPEEDDEEEFDHLDN